MAKCVRFKMTRSGKRCAKFSGRKRRSLGSTSACVSGFGSFGVKKVTVSKPKGGKCKVTIGLAIKQHSRSCPRKSKLPTNPVHKPYRGPSREKIKAFPQLRRKAAKKRGK